MIDIANVPQWLPEVITWAIVFFLGAATGWMIRDNMYEKPSNDEKKRGDTPKGGAL